MPINTGRAYSFRALSFPEMLLSGVLGCPNGKTIHSSKLFFEDSFDELKVVVVDDGKVLRYVNVCHFKTASIFLHERFDKRVDFYLDVGFIISAVFGLRPVVFDEAILVVRC